MNCVFFLSSRLRDQVLAINGIGSKDISLDDFHKILHNLRPGEVRLTIIRNHRDSSGRGTMTPESSRSRSGTGSSTMTNSSGGGGLGSCNLASLMSPAVPLSKQKSKIDNFFDISFLRLFFNLVFIHFLPWQQFSCGTYQFPNALSIHSLIYVFSDLFLS